MNITIGYTVFNKDYLIEQLVDGVAQLDGVASIFFFDGCTDESIEEFRKHSYKLKNCRAFSNDGDDVFETCSNNYILNKCSDDYCMLVQDDLILRNEALLELAEKIYYEDPNAGLIGFKDGYEMDLVNQYKNMLSSPWSKSKYCDLLLDKGEYQLRTFVNRGPLCVPKKLINKIGLFDEKFYPLFWDDNDYSMRSHKAGFNNYIAFAEIETNKSWGATRSESKIPLRDIYIANQIRFAKKWDMALPKISLYRSLKGILQSKIMKLRHRILSNSWQEQVREIVI